jgi:H+/Cl- antiporter ClcA
MKSIVIREMTIYVILLVALALVMHPDLLSNPTERFSLMQERQNYFHPLIYTFVVYLFLFIVRFVVKKTATLFKKIKDR